MRCWPMPCHKYTSWSCCISY